MKKLWMVVWVILCAAGLTAVAEEHQGHKDGSRKQEEIFDRNIRLDFNMSPAEENAKPLFVIAASPGFETEINIEGEGGERGFRVEGTIEPLDEGKIYIRFEVEAHLGQDGGDHGDTAAEFFAGTGVVLTLGKEMSVATLGDKTLLIKATVAE